MLGGSTDEIKLQGVEIAEQSYSGNTVPTLLDKAGRRGNTLDKRQHTRVMGT